MKLIKVVLFVLISHHYLSQPPNIPCDGIESFGVYPPPVNNQYLAGQEVFICYTIEGWSSLYNNYLEGFSITLGNGWGAPTPVAIFGGTLPPENCSWGTISNPTGGGQWLWKTPTLLWQNTGGFPNLVGLGYGWYFDLNMNGIAYDDGGDFCGSGCSCTWSFCFKVPVLETCDSRSLFLSITAGGQGSFSSNFQNSCPPTPLIIINNNITSNVPPIPVLSNIIHN